MKKRVAALAAVLTAIAAAPGLSTNASNGAVQCPVPHGCVVTLAANGPSPSTLTMYAEGYVAFRNTDSVSHKVVFANGLCTLTIAPGSGSPFGGECDNPFMFYAGDYAYTVDGRVAGTVVTTPLPRSVSLAARTNTIRAGTRLAFHGWVARSNSGAAPPPPVLILARENGKQRFERVARVRTKGSHQTTYEWKLAVRPHVSTTYVAEVTAQRLCYFPASRCSHPQGQVWADAESRPFTVHVLHLDRKEKSR